MTEIWEILTPKLVKIKYPDADGMSQSNCSQPDRVVVRGGVRRG